jgi:hypothetical protein
MANWASVARVGNPLAPGWTEQNLTAIEPVPGQSWQVYRQAAPAFANLIQALAAEGYQPKSSGGFNYRNIRGSDKLSQHAFGTAIDINAAANPLGGATSDLPANTAELARRFGLEWGGTWKSRPDPMHFEWTGASPGTPGIFEAAQKYGPTNELAALQQSQIPLTPIQDPPMTPERFFMGMVAGENPLRKMIFQRIGQMLS